MGAEGSLDLLSIHYLGTGPSLRCAQNDHGPHRALGIVVLTGVLLDRLDLLDDGIHGLSHLPVHGHGIVALYEIGFPSAALEEVLNLLTGNTGEDRRVADLVAIQVQDRKNRAVRDGVQELVGLPGSSQRAGLRLAVADNHRRDQIRIVKDCSETVRDGVSQLAALIDGTRRLRRAVAGYATGEGELLEQLLHAFLILTDVRVNLAVGSLQIGIRDQEVSAMSRAGQKDHIQIIALDGAVAVYIYKVLPRNGSPVTNDLFLDVIHGQRLFQQGVVQKIELACGQIVGCPPVSVHLFQHLLG